MRGLIKFALMSALLFSLSAALGEVNMYQAENGVLLGNAKVQSSGGVTYVTNITGDNDGVSIPVSVSEDGHYDIVFRTASDGSHKENHVSVDGVRVGYISTDSARFEDSAVRRIYMEKGEHNIALNKHWGWIKVDSLSIEKSEPLPADIYKIDPVLCNPNATDEAKRLFTYMCDIYGKQTLSGQQCDGGMYGNENACIWRATGGDYPAVLGLDFMDYSLSRSSRAQDPKTVEKAIEYWNKGGIVTICWHWNAPEKYITGVWYSAFYTDHTSISLKKIMDGTDKAGYDLLIKDIDLIAEKLKALMDAGVPVLWRPLHEASGGWFWWGASGAESYIKLYRLMYDRLVNHHGLNNLIWVWNGQAADWYPGDDVVDIIGEDIYPGEHVHTSQSERFLTAVGYTDARKMITLSENGCLIDPELAVRDGIMYSYFCTWAGDFVAAAKGFNDLSEKYTSADMLVKVYKSEQVVTRAELPNIKTYPLRGEQAEGK